MSTRTPRATITQNKTVKNISFTSSVRVCFVTTFFPCSVVTPDHQARDDEDLWNQPESEPQDRCDLQCHEPRHRARFGWPSKDHEVHHDARENDQQNHNSQTSHHRRDSVQIPAILHSRFLHISRCPNSQRTKSYSICAKISSPLQRNSSSFAHFGKSQRQNLRTFLIGFNNYLMSACYTSGRIFDKFNP
jgi:hypothetical protein